MNHTVSLCAAQHTGESHCRLTPTCKGWGCRFLSTPIEELPETDREKAILKSLSRSKSKGRFGVPTLPLNVH